jgi:DNA polymerase-3 subunit gamma/tau
MISILRHELISFLRQRLDAPELNLDFRVAPTEVKRLPYTAQEKFNYMVQKNPILQDLQNALGLDTDF